MTFDGWTEHPVSRHMFLAQINPDDFAKGRVYSSGTYPFILFNFIYLAPFHFVLGLPYNVAHNFLPYFYVLCLAVLLALTTKKQLYAISNKRTFLLWLLIFLSMGITITDPLPWTSSFNASRDNAFILVAGAFCYLSTWVFYDEIPRIPLLIVGIFLAMWTPGYIPAWILAGLFFHRTLKLERRWIMQVVGVCALGIVNVALPVLASRLAGLHPAGSSLLYRSGLDGSTQYMNSIFQTVYAPADPRHWPTGSYLILTALLAACFHYIFKRQKRYRPLQQVVFLLIPYATTVILFPQLSSIHPYHTDLFIFVPATFLMSFWCLQEPFWGKLTGKSYVVMLLVAGLILMTNLLTVAQMPRFASVEQSLPFVSFGVASLGFAYLGVRSKWFRQSISARETSLE